MITVIEISQKRCLENWELGPMRSESDSVDQPDRTAHCDCAMCIAEMLHNTIAQRQFC